MKRLRTSVAAVAVFTVATGGLLTGLASSASAGTAPPWEPDSNSVGGLVFFNSAGQTVTGGNINDPLPAYIQGTATVRAGDTIASLVGKLPKNGQAPGAWSGESLAGPSTYPNAAAPATTSSTLPLLTTASTDETIADLVGDYPNTDTTSDGYAGLYQLRLETSKAGSSSLSTYDSADILISGTGSTATWTVDYTTPPTPTATSTTLTATPNSPSNAGTSVTLNASVSPAVAGTVQFKNGSTTIGSPQTVSATGAGAGTASVSTSSLPAGTDNLSAVFTPSAALFYSGSTGTASYTINGIATTTTVSASPDGAPAGTAVTFTSTVYETVGGTALTEGSVAFTATNTATNATTNLGTGTLTQTAPASVTSSSLNQGSYNITATFTPDPSDTTHAGSTSTATPLSVAAPTNTPDPQDVHVNIPAGTLTITTPYTTSNPFDLGTAKLDANGDKFVAEAPFGTATNGAAGVTVTDTRAGDLPWTASAVSTNFTDGSGPSADVISAANLSFTGVAPAYISGNALSSTNPVVPTDITSAAKSGAPYGATSTSTDGLASKNAFATAAHGAGSVNIFGNLELDAPSSTPSGDYYATITFTIA